MPAQVHHSLACLEICVGCRRPLLLLQRLVNHLDLAAQLLAVGLPLLQNLLLAPELQRGGIFHLFDQLPPV